MANVLTVPNSGIISFDNETFSNLNIQPLSSSFRIVYNNTGGVKFVSRTNSGIPIERFSIEGVQGSIATVIDNLTSSVVSVTGKLITDSHYTSQDWASTYTTVCALSNNWNTGGGTVQVDSTLNNTSTNAIMNSAVTTALLALVAAPTYTQPIATLTQFSPNTFEIGATVNQTLTLNWVPGDAGSQGAWRVNKNGGQVSTGSTTLPTTYLVNETAVLNTTTYQLSVNFGTGGIKNNSLGFPDTRNQILAGAITTTSSYTGFYRRWIGSATTFPSNPNDIRTLQLSTSLDSNNTLASISSPIRIDNKFILIVIPNTKSLTTVITETNESLTTQFSLSNVNIQDAGGTNRAYKLYYLETALPLNASLTNVSIV